MRNRHISVFALLACHKQGQGLDWLNKWIKNYVNANPNAGQESKAKFPLAEARIQVAEIPGKPGSYNAVAHLRPWLQFEELTTSLRMVARIPQMG